MGLHPRATMVMKKPGERSEKERRSMAKLPNPFGGAKKVPMPVPPKETKAEGQMRADAGMALLKMQMSNPATAKKAPVTPPPGGFKSGMSGQQYEGEVLKDYSAMKPKLAGKDKILNPIKRAVGLPGRPAKMVPKKPGER